ncbi:MAG: glycosyltransferase family 4 protein [Proteobacteria bacterium]|nr:glycosyltransferase family 4 protein [Pseudomonadota bacterium]
MFEALNGPNANAMNKLFVHIWAPQFLGFGGGITAFSRALAEALHANHKQVCLFGKLDATSDWHGLPLKGARAWPFRLRTLGFSFQAIESAWQDRPSVIISTHLNFGPIANFIRGLLGIPYVLVAHGIDVHANLSRSRLSALRSANAVWAVSRWTRDRLLDVGVVAARIHILPNTVSQEVFTIAPPDSALRQRYAIAPDEKVILTVARLDAEESYKGYDNVLRALPQVRGAIGKVRFLIVGKGNDTARVQGLVADLGLSDCVTLCGFVPDGELPAHYRLADVFALPSLGEGFGIVFLEAMACGIPVLGGNRDGSVEALADGALGRLVDPTSVESISHGLIALLRREGSAFWFEPVVLRTTCLQYFGRGVFRKLVSQLITRPL